MPPRGRLTAVPPPPSEEPFEPAPDLRKSVKTAIDAMTWLKDSDAALKALALRLAEEIEQASDRAKEVADLWREAGSDMDILKRLSRLETLTSATEVVAKLGPQLQAALRDLGGTPSARSLLDKDKPIGGRLASLRAGVQNPGKSAKG